MRRLFLDIETLPAGEKNHEALKYLFEKKRAKKNKKENCENIVDFEQYLLGTSFDGTFGRILCIGYAIDDQPIDCLCYDQDEARTLKEFWEIVESISLPGDNRYQDYGVQFIGHNLIDFDMRFIYQRSIVNKIEPAYDISFARYRNYPMYDTMKEWIKWANSNVGLESIALALGIPTPKEGIDGSQVYQFYQAGKIKEICEYCKRDVECTREVYKRMVFA
jgi:3'-5' exonuclease